MKFYHERFKLLRKKERYSVNAFCQLAGISKTTLWEWDTGRRTPSEAAVRLLAKKLNISVDEISDLKPEHPTSDLQLSQLADSWLSLVGDDIKQRMTGQAYFLSKIKTTYRELNEASTIIRALLKAMPSIFYLKDIDQNYITANNMFLENLSLNSTFKVKGKNDADFYHSKEAGNNSSEDNNVLLTGVPVIKKEAYIPGSRKKKWGLISKLPILDSNNKIIGLVGTFVDITERKKLEKTRELLEKNIDSMTDGLSIFEIASQKYLYVNQTLEKISGYKLKDFYKHGCDFWRDTIIHPDYRKLVHKNATAENFPIHEEYKIIRADGKTRWIETVLSQCEFSGTDCIVAVSRDITNRKNEEKIRSLLEINIDTMTDSLCIFELPPGQFLYMNEAMEKETGYSREVFYRKGTDFWCERLHPDFKLIKEKIGKTEEPLRIKYKFIRADGDIIWVEDTFTPKTIDGKKCIISIGRYGKENKEKECDLDLQKKSLGVR